MKIVIIGAGKVGKKIADQLAPEGHDIVIVDNNPIRLNTLNNNQDVMCIQGNGALYDVQMEAEVNKSDVVVAATPDDEINMLCCLLAKKLGAKRCIARVRTPGYYKQLAYIKDELGLSMAINPEFNAANEIMHILLLPEAAQVEKFAKGRVELLQFKITESATLTGIPLSEIYKKYKIKILICSIERNGEIIIPDGTNTLMPGDRISLVCTHAEAEIFFKKIGISKNKIKSVMIVGGGRVCYYLAKNLAKLGMTVKIIESNYKRCLELSELLNDVTIINADGTDHLVLKEEGIESVDAFAALTGIDEENMIMSMYAQSKNVTKVVTKITRGSYVALSDHIGLESIVSPKQLASDTILSYIRAMQNSEKSNNIETMYKIINEKVEALEFIIKEDASYLNKKLKELKTRKNLLIASIVRNRKNIVPGGDDFLKLGDSVVVVTTEKNLRELSDIFI